MSKKKYNALEDVGRCLDYLHNDGDVFEITGIGPFQRKSYVWVGFAAGAKGVVAGYFQDKEEAVAKIMALDEVGFQGIYVGLNPSEPALLGRANERMKAGIIRTSDKDIVRICNIMIDVDPDRPTGVSSTNAEFLAAKKLAKEIMTDLTEQGWPKPLYATSGNGSHLDYKVDLLNVPESVELVKQVLLALSQKYSGNGLGIDEGVFNPGRLCRVYGTWARKGDSTKERPHRQAKIISCPDKPKPVPKELLEELAASVKKEEPKRTSTAVKEETLTVGLDVEKYLQHYEIPVQKIKKKGSATIYSLEQCPFHSSHGPGEASIIKQANGALSFKCFHSSCKGHTWKEVQEKISGTDSLAPFTGKAPGKASKKKVAVPTTLEDLETTQIIHNSIDFVDSGIVLGFRVRWVDEGKEVPVPVNIFKSDGEWQTVVNEPIITINGTEYARDGKSTAAWLDERWSKAQLERFIKAPKVPKGETLFKSIADVLHRYIDLPSSGTYYLLAAWAIGSYVSHSFAAYPFLLFFGPKESGKSKTLEVLSYLCFNGLKLKGVTEAALGDTVEALRGTVLVDQAEALPPHLTGILSDSYKRAGGKRRVVQIHNGHRSVLELNTFGPKAFGTTRRLDPDLADRCCKIGMIRTVKQLPDVEGWETCWPEIRDKLYRWILTRHQRVRKEYMNILASGTRQGELWRPLLAVLKALEVEEKVITDAHQAFLSGTKETKSELSEWDDVLFLILLKLTKKHDKGGGAELDLEHILKRVRKRLDGEEPASNRWVSHQISKYSLGEKVGRKKIKGRRATVYRFRYKHLKKLYKRYSVG